MMCGVRKYLDNGLFLEYGDAQNLENCVEAQIQIQPLPDDGYQDVARDGDPHLRLHGVLRGSDERLDPKMLLDPPEEELYLPALLVKQGDTSRGKGKIVGKEDQVLPGFRVDEPDATQFVGVTLRRVDPREHDGLVGAHVIELSPDGPQAGFDVPQAFAKRQLGEGHAEELVETGKSLDLVFPAQ